MPPAEGVVRGAGAHGAPAPSRQAPKPGPDTIYRLEIGSGRGRSERRVGRRGQEGGTAANPVADRREEETRLGRAAKQWQGATASRREDKRVGATEADRQAQCRAGVQGEKKAARTGTVDKGREG